jgi:hypothetical protein
MTDARPATDARRRIEVCLLVLGAIGLLAFGYLCLGFHSALPQVDPRRATEGAKDTEFGLGGTWTVLVLISSLTLILISGLATTDLRSSRGTLRGAIAQGLGGSVVACWSVAIPKLTSSFYFTGTDDSCTYAGCWPLHQQEFASAVPGVLTGMVMLVMAFLVNKLPWSVRALTPVAVWVTTLLIQHWVWASYLLPIFERSPS